MIRKLSAIAMALLLILSLLPAGALAAFSDTDGHWAETAIDRWGGMGIIQGYEGRFRPDDPITRADMAVILDRLMQSETEAENTYPDLPDDAYYTAAVLRARASGVMFGDGTYMRPLDLITREEAVVMLGRALGVQESDTVPAYSDYGAVSAWARGIVNTMTKAGIVRGYGGAFHPRSPMTRAEVVTVLDNVFFGLFAYVRTDGELWGALISGVPFIILVGYSSIEGYKTFVIDHPVAILGTQGAVLYGSFVVRADGVTIDSLRIDSRHGSNLSHSAIDVLARQVTITNNTFLLDGLPPHDGSVIRGVTVWPYGDAGTLCNIRGNTFNMREYENVYCAAIEVWEGKELTVFGLTGEKSGMAHIAAGDETAVAHSNFYGAGCDYGYLRADWSTGSPVIQYSFGLAPPSERRLSPSVRTENPINGSDKSMEAAPQQVLSPPAWLLERAEFLAAYSPPVGGGS